MTGTQSWSWTESHLLPDAIVALVDGELSLGAQDRATAHIARCASCAAEVAAQQQARNAVQCALTPGISAGFLASLRAIPEHVEVTVAPDNLAITEDGQFVTVQRPEKIAGLRGPAAFGTSTPLGGSAPLGTSANTLGSSGLGADKKRGVGGAGVVVSGLVLGALALVVAVGADGDEPASAVPGEQPTGYNVLPAHLGSQVGSPVSTTHDATPVSTPSTIQR